jgi:ABC-2 type transport system permease protein
MDAIGRSLSTIWVVTKQEFNLLFNSPVIYFIGGIWLLFNSIFFMLNFSQMNTGTRPPEIGSTINTMIFMLLFFAPAITMRLVSEELSQGTHELLFTSPIRDWEIIVGKWLGAFLALSIFILLTGIYPLILALRGTPDPGSIGAAYLGLWLAAGTMLAIGTLASSLTRYQLVSFLVSLSILLVLWLAGILTQLINNPELADILSEFSINTHASNFVQRSLIDPVDVAYFVGMTIISLFLAAQILGSRRYTG